MSSATALVPAYDFDKAVLALRANTSTNLGSLLAELATLPAPKVKKSADLAIVERVGEDLMRNIAELPTVFNRVDPPTKRALNKPELVKLLEEKERIDAVEKATKKRKERIHSILSDHFDCVAERKKLIGEKTMKDEKGHYLVAVKGAPETQLVEGSGKYFTRERTGDTVIFTHDKALAMYESGEITRADYLACTRPVRTREVDEDKLSRMLLSKKQRERGQRLIAMIGIPKLGRLSINLRGK